MSNPIKIKIDGVTKTLNEWCEIFGVNRTTVFSRVRFGRMSFEEALKRPLRGEPVETKTGINAKKQLCKKCKYRGRIGSNMPADLICDYIGQTGHRRPCKAADCTVYKKGNPPRTNKAEMNRFFMAERGKIWK